MQKCPLSNQLPREPAVLLGPAESSLSAVIYPATPTAPGNTGKNAGATWNYTREHQRGQGPQPRRTPPRLCSADARLPRRAV